MKPNQAIRSFLFAPEPGDAPAAGGGGDAPPPPPLRPDAPFEPPSLGGVFADKLGMEPPPAPEVAKKDEPPAPEPKPAATVEPWTVDRYFKERVPEIPEFLKDDTKKVDSWKTLRSQYETTMKALEAESAEKLRMKQEMEALRAAKPAAGADAKDKEAWALEVQALKESHAKETAELRQKAARAELADNHVFRVEFEGRRARLLEEAQDVAKAAKVPEDVLKGVLAAKSEYDLAKALKDVEDETAAGLLKEKGKAFLTLTREREAALNAADPVAELAKWKDYEASFQGVISSTFTDKLKSGLLAAVPEVAKKLQADDPYFQTAAGQAELRAIGARFERGYDLSYEEVVAAMASQPAARVHRAMAAELAKENAALKEKLARFEKADPAALGGEPAGGQQQPAGGMFAEMFQSRLR